MLSVHPQFITDTAGKKLVVLPLKEFNSIMEEIDEIEDIRLYDEAKKKDDGTRISFAEYLKKRNSKI